MPVAMHESAHQQEQRALRLVEVGDESIDDFVFIARRDDYLRRGMERIESLLVEIIGERLQCLLWLHLGSIVAVRLPLRHLKARVASRRIAE